VLPAVYLAGSARNDTVSTNIIEAVEAGDIGQSAGDLGPQNPDGDLGATERDAVEEPKRCDEHLVGGGVDLLFFERMVYFDFAYLACYPNRFLDTSP
jgi:hypothetical protein